MTLRPALATIALLALPATVAASEPTGGAATAQTPADTSAGRAPGPRRAERKPPVPLKPHVVEAPGAALMMIPAAFDPLAEGAVIARPRFFRTF